MTFRTPFQRALAKAKGTLRALKSAEIVYDNGTDDPITVAARVGATNFRVDTGSQFNTRIRTVDFLIEVNALKNEDDELFEPAAGHRIICPIDEDRNDVYECLPVGDEPPWRFSDTAKDEYRIHTKRIKQEPTT